MLLLLLLLLLMLLRLACFYSIEVVDSRKPSGAKAKRAEQAAQAAHVICVGCVRREMLRCGGDTPNPNPHQQRSQAHSADSP